MLIKRKCKTCGKPQELEVDEEAYMRWQLGEKVQDAFPHLTDSEREMLITGTCDECWDYLFKECTSQDEVKKANEELLQRREAYSYGT
jgi:hypothetical protein